MKSFNAERFIAGILETTHLSPKLQLDNVVKPKFPFEICEEYGDHVVAEIAKMCRSKFDNVVIEDWVSDQLKNAYESKNRQQQDYAFHIRPGSTYSYHAAYKSWFYEFADSTSIGGLVSFYEAEDLKK